MVVTGKKYKTIGGWEALVVHISSDNSVFYAIHAPGTANETIPICHMSNGITVQTIAVPSLPRFNKAFPCDILINEQID